MTPLIIREMSALYSKSNTKRVKHLFLNYAPTFFLIAMIVSVYISFNSSFFANLIGGESFKNSSKAIAIMAFYPAHQTYGQMCSSVFLASNKTNIIRNVTTVIFPVGFLLSIALIGPLKLFDENFGAVGLALKVVSVQIFAVNIYLYIISRQLKFSFYKIFSQQLTTLASLYLIITISNYLSKTMFHSQSIIFLMTTFLYFILTGIIIFLFPKLFSRKVGFLFRKKLKNNFKIFNIRN